MGALNYSMIKLIQTSHGVEVPPFLKLSWVKEIGSIQVWYLRLIIRDIIHKAEERIISSHIYCISNKHIQNEK